ncbi:threonine--tRNA ligase [Parasphaerochaeta coccoides]|uniref:Threonine--tRNA ligase n=1 Tax=Parasphaerochaeta coccoides (strain ATCC BAA-1237 / DSM 17374 / SPN1) TaxID=760011 RepID=F4GKP4_PARC1|nr:threonine--tRNA ligase [Parasphaerochaeta coccoides]AEC01453.1 Ser-tRNA(Thr) hydrolase; threonyl-tRNA synthetase [Parasphaerochaeta coccoides DSM 17374]
MAEIMEKGGQDAAQEKLERIRHSMAHVMAEAVLQMFPTAQIAIGPVIENGFYYDFDLPRPLVKDDLEEITERMKKIIAEDKPFIRTVVSRDEARRRFSDQKYKVELLDAIPADEDVSLYDQGGFIDLCRGPHVASTKELRSDSFALLNIAGAYWRGKETNPMLTRIYGTAWANPKDLRLYLQHLEDVEKRDNRRLGKEQDLFSLHEEAGPGLVYWHPRGARVRVAIENFWRDEHYKNGYEMVFSPHVGRSWLWETSGHLGFYKDSMYPAMEMDKSDYYVKPMNCPFHIMIYNNSKRSYRDLPIRMAELGTVYRYEKAGALHGLMRVRGFTQDDAHLFCTPEQMDDEIRKVLEFSLYMLRSFGFQDVKAYLSTRPEESVGERERWDAATKALRNAIEKEGLAYEVDEGGGAFYGPKIDLKVKDAIGREWQLSTVQFDFNMSDRFQMTFVDKDGQEKRPYMIHRALLGSIERFFGVLIENYAGAFPPWLAPEQIMVVPVGEAFFPYATALRDRLRKEGLRADADLSDDRMNAKIRNAQLHKIPYQLVVGEREQSEDKVSVRYRNGNKANDVPTADFIAEVKAAVAAREQV